MSSAWPISGSAAADTSHREILVTRVFDAPRALVSKAWTDPKHLAHWWGPNGFSITTYEMDFKPGGVWRFVMHPPDARDYQNEQVLSRSAADSNTIRAVSFVLPPSSANVVTVI
jgi:hypothetical protein